MTKCKDCRYWAGLKEHWKPQKAVCSIVHVGGGLRPELARIFPVGSTAFLETDQEFSCNMGRKA